MEIKKKVSLNNENMNNFGVFITHCKERQWFGADYLNHYDHGICKVCERPLVTVSGKGKLYYIGDPVFEE